MSEFPKPYEFGRWEKDCEEDYRKAKNDEERKRMLLLFGFDANHISDAQRLFPDLQL